MILYNGNDLNNDDDLTGTTTLLVQHPFFLYLYVILHPTANLSSFVGFPSGVGFTPSWILSITS